MLTNLAMVPLIGMPGIWEWLIIIGVVLLLFGATKLPKLGKGLGEGIRNFKNGLKGEVENSKELLATSDDSAVSEASGDNQ